MIKLIATGLMLSALSTFGVRSGYVISGSVEDAAGRGARGAEVCALASDFDPNKPNVSIPCTMSDARGRFELSLSKAGSYTLFYTYFTRGYVSTYQPFFRQPSASRPRVVLDRANPKASVTIKMPPQNGLLVGKIVDAATGLPVESVEFLLCDATSAGV